MTSALLSLACVVVSACGRQGGATGTRVVMEAGAGWDASARSTALAPFLDLFFAEPLLGVGWEGRPIMKLAESYEWLDGHQTLRLNLQRGVVFHDGTPFVAADAVRILQSRQIEFVTSITADDDHTIRVRLSRPDAFLLEKFAEFTMVSPERPGIGTGPFRLDTREGPGRLEAFDRYYRGRPAIDEIHVRTYDSQRAAWAAMLRGEVDFLHDVSREAVDFVEAQSNVSSYRYLAPFYLPLVFNVGHPVLKNVEVRRAINEAIDRGQIVSKAMRGRAMPAEGPIWPYFWAASTTEHAAGFDPGAARQRLDAAGFPVKPGDGASRPSSRFTFTCLYWNDGPQYERIALVLQKQLFEVGIDVDMRPVPLDELIKRVGTGDYDAFLLQMNSGRGLRWTDRFWHSRNQPRGLEAPYRGADATLDRLRLATSDAAMRDGVAELQRVFRDDPPAAFLVWLMNARAVSRRFEIPIERDRDILSIPWLWKPASTNQQARR